MKPKVLITPELRKPPDIIKLLVEGPVYIMGHYYGDQPEHIGTIVKRVMSKLAQEEI